MKMRKAAAAIVIALLLLVSATLAACGGDDEETPATGTGAAQTAPPQETEATAPVKTATEPEATQAQKPQQKETAPTGTSKAKERPTVPFGKKEGGVAYGSRQACIKWANTWPSPQRERILAQCEQIPA